ncbi:MFS transporter, partial [Metarhizium majus ARSEF 297]
MPPSCSTFPASTPNPNDNQGTHGNQLCAVRRPRRPYRRRGRAPRCRVQPRLVPQVQPGRGASALRPADRRGRLWRLAHRRPGGSAPRNGRLPGVLRAARSRRHRAAAAAPEVRLLEMTVCRAYYAPRDPGVIGPPPLGYVDESLCKEADIQVSLAYLRAWKRCLDSIPGYFYDVFSPKSIWFGSLFLALGGGSRMLTAVLNSVIVDVCAEEKRSVVFYIFGAAIHITDIVALPLGSWFLSQDLWLPFKFCSPLMLSSFAIVLLLPETMALSQYSPLVNMSRQDRERTPERKRVGQRNMADALRRLYGMARRNDGTLGWFALIFIHSFAIQSSPLLLQFASKRLEWTLARAGYLFSIRAVCAIVVLVVLVPAANFLVGRKARHPHQDGIDILVCRLTLFLLAVGNIIIGFSTSAIFIILGTIIVSFGIPFPQAMQGILGDIAQREGSGTASLYAGQALTELAGASLGTLSMATIFDLGSHLGGERELGLGMPFWASAVSNLSYHAFDGVRTVLVAKGFADTTCPRARQVLFAAAFFASYISLSTLGLVRARNVTVRRDE